jgi:hypothetical protein
MSTVGVGGGSSNGADPKRFTNGSIRLIYQHQQEEKVEERYNRCRRSIRRFE